MTRTSSFSEAVANFHSTYAPKGAVFGLDRIKKALSFLGNPEKDFASIHITGTNGKGSLAWKLSSVFKEAGLVVGRFSSPHLDTIRERISVDDSLISEQDFLELLHLIESKQLELSFFEFISCIAFLYFSRKKVDLAVVEVGLGGKRDATNVLASNCCVITSIAKEHCQILGDTEEEILIEKLAICQPSSSLIIGPGVDQKLCEQYHKGKIIKLDKGLDFEEENQSMALAVFEEFNPCLKLEEKKLQKALKKRPPCRMESLSIDGREVLLDLAHNDAALKALLSYLKRHYGTRRIFAIAAFSKDKDLAKLLNLCKFFDRLLLAGGKHPRLCTKEDYHKIDSQLCFFPSSLAAYKALKESSKAKDLLVLLGSFNMLIEFRRSLSEKLALSQPPDPETWNELLL